MERYKDKQLSAYERAAALADTLSTEEQAQQLKYDAPVRAGVGGLRQQSGGGVVDLVVARQVSAGGGVCHRLRDGGGRLLAALFEEDGGDAEGQQHRQHAEDADQNGPMLHGSHGFVLLLFFRLILDSVPLVSGMGKLVHRAESPVRQLFAVSGHEDRRKGGDLFPAAVAVEHSGGVQAAVHSALHIVPAVAHHQHPLALHDGLGKDVADDVGLVVAALIHGRTAHEGEVRRKALLFEDGSHNVGGLAGGRAEGQARSLETAQHLHHAGVDTALVAALGGVAHAVALRGLLDFAGSEKCSPKLLRRGGPM